MNMNARSYTSTPPILLHGVDADKIHQKDGRVTILHLPQFLQIVYYACGLVSPFGFLTNKSV
jgi:hypothetical protein